MNTIKLTKYFVEDFKEIVKLGKKNGLPDKQIETLQEGYAQSFMSALLKGSGMPPEVCKKILKNIQHEYGELDLDVKIV